MASRYKKDNGFRFRKTGCELCGEQVSDRKSESIPQGDKDGQFVLARDKNKGAVTRKALPRQHRKGVGCRE